MNRMTPKARATTVRYGRLYREATPYVQSLVGRCTMYDAVRSLYEVGGSYTCRALVPPHSWYRGALYHWPKMQKNRTKPQEVPRAVPVTAPRERRSGTAPASKPKELAAR